MFIVNLLLFMGGFCALDSALSRLGLEGVYYAVHTIHNAAMVYVTGHEVLQTFTNFAGVSSAPNNMIAVELCFALHFYHCAYYWRKFRPDDWLHHGLMIGIALPIGTFVHAGTLLGFSLFFTTGLPGGIDYFFLFLSRNGWCSREVEKRINTALSVWIRSPGCVAQAALTVAYLSLQPQLPRYTVCAALLTAALNYWNGQYFMHQVVYDAGQRGIRDLC